MKPFVYFLFAAYLFILSSCNGDNPILNIEGGEIIGVETATEGVLVYKGIPYAAPPVGDLRWREPQPVIPWDGIKVADTFGDAAMQDDQVEGAFYQHEFYQAGDPDRSEDCLYLNVWTPAPGKTNKKLPVTMWIHGGGFQFGFGHEIEFDGEAWAKRGVILITINHRLGPFGFLSHPLLTAENPNHVSGNQGILDLIAALNWIKNNIEQFGGDPDNVTVMGQSGGAAQVQLLTISPLAKGLIDKAVIMSGGGIREPETAGGSRNYMEEDQDATKAMFDYFGMTTLHQMRAYPADSLLTLSSRYIQALQAEQGVLPQARPSGSPQENEAASQNNPSRDYQSYNQLMGSRTRQAELRAAQEGQNAQSGVQNIPPPAQNRMPALRRVNMGPTIDGYSIKGTYVNEALAGNMLKIPCLTGYVSNDVARLAKGIDKFCLLNEEQGNPNAYAYEFARELPGDDAGAFHSGELWYIFNTLGRSWRPMTDADYALSEKMVDCWTNFARTGNPDSSGQYGWKPFTKDNQQIYVFDIEE